MVLPRSNGPKPHLHFPAIESPAELRAETPQPGRSWGLDVRSSPRIVSVLYPILLYPRTCLACSGAALSVSHEYLHDLRCAESCPRERPSVQQPDLCLLGIGGPRLSVVNDRTPCSGTAG